MNALDVLGEPLRAAIVELVDQHIEQRLAALAPRAETWPEWMSVETAARYLDVSVERVRKLKDARRIPFHQEGVSCRVFFRRADLDEWMCTFARETRRG